MIPTSMIIIKEVLRYFFIKSPSFVYIILIISVTVNEYITTYYYKFMRINDIPAAIAKCPCNFFTLTQTDGFYVSITGYFEIAASIYTLIMEKLTRSEDQS